jgi:hypothetical protein
VFYYYKLTINELILDLYYLGSSFGALMIFPPTSQEMQDPCYGFVAQAVERRRAEQEGKRR